MPHRKWSAQQVQRIIAREESDEELADEFGASLAAIRGVRFRYQADAKERRAAYEREYRSRPEGERNIARQPWTKEEEAIIYHSNGERDAELLSKLPKRTLVAIRSHRHDQLIRI